MQGARKVPLGDREVHNGLEILAQATEACVTHDSDHAHPSSAGVLERLAKSVTCEELAGKPLVDDGHAFSLSAVGSDEVAARQERNLHRVKIPTADAGEIRC